MVVSPDEGGVKRSVSVANDLSLDFALIHNRNKPRMEKKNKKMSSSASHSRLQPDQDENGGGGGAVAGASSSNGASAGGSLSEAARIRRISRASSVRSSDHKRSACLSGDVEGRTVIVIDDMIDTGKTLKFAAEVRIDSEKSFIINIELLSLTQLFLLLFQMLEIEGASRMYFFASHGVFSRGCMAKIREIGSDFLKAVVVTNSMPQERHTGEIPGFHVIDVSGIIEY